MTNIEAAEHFASLAPEDEATVLLYHPDAAYLPTGSLCELDKEDLAGLEDACYVGGESLVGRVAVRTDYWSALRG